MAVETSGTAGGSGSRKAARPAAAGHVSARRMALDILIRVEATDAYANVLLDSRLRASAFSRPDRALVTELVYGVLRWRGMLDWLLTPLLDRPITRLDATVCPLLRLGP